MKLTMKKLIDENSSLRKQNEDQKRMLDKLRTMNQQRKMLLEIQLIDLETKDREIQRLREEMLEKL